MVRKIGMTLLSFVGECVQYIYIKGGNVNFISALINFLVIEILVLGVKLYFIFLLKNR